MERHSRLQSLPHLLVPAALGGAVFGLVEVARVLGASRLYFSGADVGILLALGGVSAGLIGAAAAPALLVLPPRALGEQRWLGLVAGLVTPALADIAVWWFSDPPPFQDPLPLQGNPVGFLVVAGLAAGLVLGVGRMLTTARARGVAALVGAVSLCAFALSGRSVPAAASEPLPAGAPNVLLVTLDTTRADHVGAYGNPIDTPAFDRIAKEGALFLDASAVAAVTGPSHTSMLSGSGPWDHGVLLNGIAIPQDRTLLAEVLHDRGWATGAFVSSYVLDGSYGFRRGFQVYDDDFGGLPGAQSLLATRIIAMLQRHFHPEEELERRGGDTVDHALAWIGDQHGTWFAWVHLFDAHGPYAPPPPFDTRYYQGDPRDPAHTSMKDVKNVAVYLKKSLEGITDVNYVTAQYEGEISYADQQLGRLLDSIDTKNTLVVVIGDHGESFGEHGVWFNHGDDVYETSLHVPFAMRWPGRVNAAVRVEKPFEGTDLAPTVLALVGVPRAASMTGVSSAGLVGDFEGDGRIEARALCFDRAANIAGRERGEITKPKWRLAGLRGASSRYVQRETGAGPEYYDLVADPTGEKDVYANVACSTQGKQLLEILDAHAGELFQSTASERSAGDVGEEERKKLEALGYLSGTEGEGSGTAATAVDASVPCPGALGDSSPAAPQHSILESVLGVRGSVALEPATAAGLDAALAGVVVPPAAAPAATPPPGSTPPAATPTVAPLFQPRE